MGKAKLENQMIDPEDSIKPIVEALLFSADSPLPVKKIVSVIDNSTPSQVKLTIDVLNEEYREMQRAFHIIEIAEGYQVVSRKEYGFWIKRMIEERKRSRVSRAALETLAIVAYKQPISRPDIEAIRGVNSEGVLRTLVDRNLIVITGRSGGLGRPLLYGTTREFLYYFGLNQLSDLPKLNELKVLVTQTELEAEEEISKESEEEETAKVKEEVSVEDGTK